MKVQKVTLKEIETVQVDGEFEKRFINEKHYPAFLTNHTLKRGKELGYIETSLFSELAKLQQMQKMQDDDGNMDIEALEHFDEEKAIQIIYLAVTGASKDIQMSFDEFLSKYHGSFEETMTLYANLIADLVTSDPNQFAEGLKKSTGKSDGKK